ncbi:MAG TPA: hypothetical protein VHP32_02125 [Ignavibacteria bacterium]|nr:hypothetical protein [Ignavibacteria bacterium]
MLSKSILFYFNEFSAIPQEIRKKFYFSKSKRINSFNQKNLILLRIIENYLESEEAGTLWNETLICKKLKINISMLRCHRSRILKELREYYFKFQNKETNVFDRGLLYYKNSMVREAKNCFDRCISALEKESKSKKQFDKAILLSEIYEFYFIYYHRHRNKNRFREIYEKLSGLNKFVSKNCYNKKTKNILKMRMHYCEALRYQFLVKTQKPYLIALKNLEHALNYVEAINYTKYILKFLFLKGNLELEVNGVDSARIYYTKGFELASKENDENFENEKIIFRIKLMLLNSFTDKNLIENYIQEMGEYHFKMDKNYDADYILHLLFHYLRFASSYGDTGMFNRLSYELVNNLFIYSRSADAFFRLYTLKADKYISNLTYWESNNYDSDIKINKNVLEKFSSFNQKALINLDKLYSIDQLFFIYITQIELEFWKWKNGDTENAFYFINKIERLIKKGHTISNIIYFNTLKICVRILADTFHMDKKQLTSKYYPAIKNQVNILKKREDNYNILYDYTLLKLLSQNLEIKEITKEITALYNWIKKERYALISHLQKTGSAA